MTSIIGIPTNYGEEAVVLASDTLISGLEKEDNSKEEKFKIIIGDFFAVGSAGPWDIYLQNLFNYLTEQKDFQSFMRFLTKKRKPEEFQSLAYTFHLTPKAVKKKLQEIHLKKDPKNDLEKQILKLFQDNSENKTELEKLLTSILYRLKDTVSPIAHALEIKYLDEIALTNRYRFVRSNPEDFNDNTNRFILAANKPKLSLYLIDEFGTFRDPLEDQDITYICAGSGAVGIDKYLEDKMYEKEFEKEIKPDEIDTKTALKLAICSVKYAIEKDKYSGRPLDIVVITKDKIFHHGPDIKKTLDDAANNKYAEIIDRYKTKE